MNEDNSKNTELADLRKEIDNIDEKLISLVDKRGEIAKKIGEIKKDLDLKVYHPERENKIIENLSKKSRVFEKSSIESIWKELMASCRSIQGTIDKIGFLGPEGTFSHQAASKFFSRSSSEFYPFSSIEELFNNLEKNLINYIIVPIENSIEGTVNSVLDYLIERNVFIIGEIDLKISQNIIGIEDSKLENLTKIYSHPQAIQQARIWIKENLPNIEIEHTNSTAEAVKFIKNQDEKSLAAIGSETSAKFYGLDILKESVEDNPQNFTRFMILSKNRLKIQLEAVKSTIIFVTKHSPGALYQVIKLFAEANINLTKIESRPRRLGKWEYIFIMDFEGNIEEPQVEETLNDLESKVIWFKYLGTYPKSV
ncbi:MAG: prephenate dehydratase [Promethearchaeota archaeon]|nr:MAG: prephenate dehydratase [Candidatus Lokiarchaeota archaeon]